MYTCPVCGFGKLDEPPYDQFGRASFEICPCCGAEFGYDDAGKTHDALREEWKRAGMPWWSTVTAPEPGWDPAQQLAALERGRD